MDQTAKITVAVLYGGQSSEHSVSCISAGAIIGNLDPERYEIAPVGITPQGAWVPGTTDTQALSAHGRELPEVPDGPEHLQLMFGGPNPGELRFSTGPRAGEVYAVADVVFPVLHGKNGEDGTMQGLLDLAGVPYVGNGVLASAAAMDKVFTKRLAREAGIPVGAEVVLTERRDLTQEERDALGLPVFVKPARGGSSIGISKVTEWSDFPAALELAFSHDSKAVVEAMLHGREVECGVLQHPDGRVVASVPAMLLGTEDGEEGFYGFDAKYLANTVSAQIPAQLDEHTTADVQHWAVKTFEALGCEGLARVDFFVTERGPVLNEPNTLPGFTPISMYPQMFLASGMEYPELLDTLIARALARSAR
ncbi:D-alanine--D-alanine ligase family protein [Corynebacterium heidelbergense]|uniref:D-alanine--D-alanine ligase n=1 Tax=Corynebacterium heidelbergense TaxID=2055947 RepID=A0A364V414_9CORY|nr:D-alanine--D-alanine ligase family protein [Corynebacterium heidelbergense]RAV31369.1 D-alanine--D-alanine ligase [Corynebacterium heidelbergense]